MKKKYCLISLAVVLISLGTLVGCGDKITTPDESTITNSTESKEAANTENSNKEDNSASKENNTGNKDSLNKENTEDKSNTANNDKDNKTTGSSNSSKNSKSNENKGNDSKKEKVESGLPKTKSEYLSKMQEVDNESSKLDEEYKTDEGMSQAGMNAISGKQAKLYDDELNRIYKFLQQNLSAEKFKELEKSEVEWINQKESKLDSIKKEFEGGSILPLQVNSAVAKESRDRCYYLINNYME